MDRLKYAYPIVFAVVPVVTLAADHIGQFYMSDLLALVGVSAATALVVWVVLCAMPWKGDRFAVGALIAFLGVFLLFYMFPVGEVVGRAIPGVRQRFIVPFVAVAALGAVWWIARRPPALEKATAFLAVMSVILVVLASVRLGTGMARGARIVENSELAQELAQPIPLSESGPAASGPQRDIFLIILDMYANELVLQNVFGYDNRPFLDSLQTLGFTVPDVRSNYTRTILSLASILNLEHVDRIADETGPRSQDRSLGRYVTENNRTVSFLKDQGYAFHFYPPLWGGLTQKNRFADFQFRPRRNLLETVLAKSSLHRRLWGATALGQFVTVTEDKYDVDSVLRSFARLRETSDEDGPLFVFAHFFVPHNPYILDEMCNPAGPRRADGGGASGLEQRRAMYIAQLECVNRQVLELVPALLARSPEPIILLQADHGTRTINDFDPAVHDSVSYAQAEERFGALGAYYLPPGGGEFLPDSITTVNLLRYVFSHYFGADLPPVSDQLFYSDGDYEYLFFPVESAPVSAAPGEREALSGD
jgi:hypothetical protein